MALLCFNINFILIHTDSHKSDVTAFNTTASSRVVTQHLISFCKKKKFAGNGLEKVTIFYSGRIKALPLRRQNYCFGDKCSVASAVTSAGYCGDRNRKI